jgi:hypothetical protein
MVQAKVQGGKFKELAQALQKTNKLASAAPLAASLCPPERERERRLMPLSLI